MVIVDQVSAVIPLLKAATAAKVLFYCHFPDMLLAQRASALRRCGWRGQGAGAGSGGLCMCA